MSTYDRAITVFSPDGQLLQVQYAKQAVRLGSPVVGVRGGDAVVIVSERKPQPRLFDYRTEKKICQLDQHIVLAYAGLRADARVLITRAQMECQAHRLSMEDPVTVEYITKHIASEKQLYTQRNGRRPFGVSCLIGGVDLLEGAPQLFQTEPCGTFIQWKAAATGRNDTAVRAFLEEHYRPEAVNTEEGAINLAFRAILQCQPPNSNNNFEVAVVKHRQPVLMMDPKDVKVIVAQIKSRNNLPNEPTI